MKFTVGGEDGQQPGDPAVAAHHDDQSPVWKQVGFAVHSSWSAYTRKTWLYSFLELSDTQFWNTDAKKQIVKW